MVKMGEETSVAEKVKEILDESSRFKTIAVSKEVEPILDCGNLLISDLQPIDPKEFRKNQESFLSQLARDNTQLLFNAIWNLPIEKVENVIVAQLPEPSTILPREKPVPKPKAMTKWEEYAKKKGIQKKKRGRMIWDEDLKEWKPRYGYKRANDEQSQWCIEVPENKDPYEDQFEKIKNEKKERVAKNEFKRLKNIARNTKGSKDAMSSQLKPEANKDKQRLTKEIDVAKVSTASMGKFQENLPNEKVNTKTGKKRKFETVCGDMGAEKQKSLDIFSKLNKPDALNVTKAVNKKVAQEQAMANNNKKKGKGSMKIKNQRFRKGKQSALDKMKGKTLGKKRR